MNENDFDRLIQRMRDISIPDCPGAMESNVLRRIRVASDKAGASWFDWVFDLIRRPGFIVTASVLTIAVSSSMTYISNRSQVGLGPSELVASRALGFDVFLPAEKQARLRKITAMALSVPQ